MPSLIGTYIAANYQTTAAPFSNFGTRNLAFLKVTIGGGSTPNLTLGTDPVTGVVDPASNGSTSTYPGSPTATQYFNNNAYNAPNSYFSVAVRTLQQFFEIYYVGIPSSTAFVMAVAFDTASDPATASPNTQLIGTSDVTNPTLSGSNVFQIAANQVLVALGNWGSGTVTIAQGSFTGTSFS
jgi:hypothetical protein